MKKLTSELRDQLRERIKLNDTHKSTLALVTESLKSIHDGNFEAYSFQRTSKEPAQALVEVENFF